MNRPLGRRFPRDQITNRQGSAEPFGKNPDRLSIGDCLARRTGRERVVPEQVRARANGRQQMRVMVLVKATGDSEAGVMPDQKLLEDMGNYNDELVKAGIMLAGEGLHPSSKGKRVRFSGTRRTVIDGPFAETKELVAGFWLWQVKSIDEAIEWAKRCPNPMAGESELEIRPVFEAEDFGEAYTPELQEQERRQREQIEAQQQ